MKLLIKFPTRSRPDKALNIVKTYIEMAAQPKLIDFLITIDTDDKAMTADICNQLKAIHPVHVQIDTGYSSGKIHACNRGMNTYSRKWDIVILASDDMICQVRGWDDIVRSKMKEHFPDTDGCLWFWDGDPATKSGSLCTMNITGRKYYDRFTYLYHPSYISLWCDNEYTEVAKLLNKIIFIDQVLFKHVHWSNTPGLQPDQLMNHTNKYYPIDEKNYYKRKSKNFDLKPA